LGRQHTTSQYFQPLTPQTLALGAAAIHCVLSEHTSGNEAMVMISQDEYRGTSSASRVINLTPEATPLMNHTLVGRMIPPAVATPRGLALLNSSRCSLALIDAPLCHSALVPPFRILQLRMVHFGLDFCFYIEFNTP